MYAVIMAGGKGTRFWPKSREKMPKHLLDIVCERTIIQETVDRIAPLIPVENILIVTGLSHAEELMKQVPQIPAENIIIEPIGRNTAPCIAYGTFKILKENENAVIAVSPADQIIGRQPVFEEIVRAEI